MNFIGLYICFKALNPHIAYDEFKFDNYFHKKYLRVSEIEDVIEDVTFNLSKSYDNSKYSKPVCEISLKSGEVVLVNEECDLLIEELRK